MHVAGKPRMSSGYVEAQSRMVHHGGSYEHVPAHAWARFGDRMFVLDAEDDVPSHALVAKCEAMLRRGCGWRVATSAFQ